MSIEAIGWVLEHCELVGSERLILISLANHAGELNDDGSGPYWECYPSIETITHQCGIARKRTTQTAMASLELKGWIIRRINAAPDIRIPGNRRSNLYRLHRRVGRPCRRGCLDCTEPTPGPAPAPTSPVADVAALELVVCPPLPGPSFDDWYHLYPKKKARAAAAKAWMKATKSAPAETIVAGLVAQLPALAAELADPARARYVPYPASWLNAERWADEVTDTPASESFRNEHLLASLYDGTLS